MLPGTYAPETQTFSYANGSPLLIRGYGGRATFDGQGSADWALNVRPRAGTSMKLTLQDLGVRNAGNGIRIGKARDVNVRNFTAENLGSLHARAAGFAALGVFGSANVSVVNPTFRSIENDAATAAYVHAIYAIGAPGLRVEGGSYTLISGDPIRLRNGSDGALVRGGRFDRAGRYAVFSDWRDPSAGEVLSKNGVISAASVTSGYGGKALLVGVVACFRGSATVDPACGLRVGG